MEFPSSPPGPNYNPHIRATGGAAHRCVGDLHPLDTAPVRRLHANGAVRPHRRRLLRPSAGVSAYAPALPWAWRPAAGPGPLHRGQPATREPAGGGPRWRHVRDWPLPLYPELLTASAPAPSPSPYLPIEPGGFRPCPRPFSLFTHRAWWFSAPPLALLPLYPDCLLALSPTSGPHPCCSCAS